MIIRIKYRIYHQVPRGQKQERRAENAGGDEVRAHGTARKGLIEKVMFKPSLEVNESVSLVQSIRGDH